MDRVLGSGNCTLQDGGCLATARLCVPLSRVLGNRRGSALARVLRFSEMGSKSVVNFRGAWYRSENGQRVLEKYVPSVHIAKPCNTD